MSYITNGGSSDEFIRISDDVLMYRLIGGTETGAVDPKICRKVLTGISLFQKIGFEDQLEAESKWLATYLKVEWDDFRQVVAYQRRRGIIQGDFYRSVTPFMLRVHLLYDWWETYGFTKDNFDKFIADIPEAFRFDLIERFFDHIPYVYTTSHGRKFAEAILDQDGIYADGELLRSELGANFFIRLTEANPEIGLSVLTANGRDLVKG